EPLPSRLTELPVAGGDIVSAGVAADMFEGPLLGDAASAPADHHHQLRLEVDLVGVAREDDRIVVPNEGGGELVEDDRLGGDLRSGFGGVVGVVEADAEDLLRP